MTSTNALRQGTRDDLHDSSDAWAVGRDRLPRQWTAGLLLGAVVYALFRITQTVLLSPYVMSISISALDRVLVSLADGLLMAAVVPLAIASSTAFPLERPIRWRNVAAHLAIAIVASATWIIVLMSVYRAVTDAAPLRPIAAENLSWFVSNVFAYGLLVACVHALRLHQRLAEREVHAARLASQLSTARLETLRAQLHPHFLFNTLNSLSELIHVDPDAADAMVVRLGTLLRLSLDVSAEDEVTLARELEVASLYLDLHRVPGAGRLCVEVDASPNVLGARVPAMLLQPLIENALRHGLGPRAARGILRIAAEAAGERLRIEVSDDGVGLPASMVEGVGLSNTRRRLRELYGQAHSFAIGPGAEGGTTTIVELPLRA
jgi:signal transduction histidine kinase